MKSKPFTRVLAAFLIVALIAPPALIAFPQRVQAQLTTLDPANLIQNTITAIRSTLTHALAITSTAAQVAQEVNAYVLQPLAFVLSGNILKAITAGVISFVIGKANGTGIPQFVTDVQKSLQTVGDITALTFLDQFGKNSNSPFAGSIISSLRNDYLSKSSLAGFWAANMDTLAASTPSYAPDYLTGNWSHGGIRAWFALTTQTQNNPYTLYQNSQGQLAGLIGPGTQGATGARLAELQWGDGFTSWCGANDETTLQEVDVDAIMAEGVNPGDPCMKDGKTGIIKTPGSVIVASLNKALGSQTDAILRMGNVGPEINGILRNIGTVMETVNFATQILGGVGSGGLLGANETSSSNSTSRLIQYQSTPGYLGVTTSGIYQNAAGADMLGRIAQYEASWNAISTSANTASASVTNLENSCAAQASEAQTALTTIIAPVLTQAAAAASKVTAARAMVQKVQTAPNANDIQTLQTMSPTATDVANSQQEAQILGTATANPEGSLSVTGGSLTDRMNLVSMNAEVLAIVCTP